MLHKISEMCDLIDVIHNKSTKLRNLKYNTPKEKQQKVEIDFQVSDIQAMCRQIAEDRQHYEKR
jgi:hypothetical protein